MDRTKKDTLQVFAFKVWLAHTHVTFLHECCSACFYYKLIQPTQQRASHYVSIYRCSYSSATPWPHSTAKRSVLMTRQMAALVDLAYKLFDLWPPLIQREECKWSAPKVPDSQCVVFSSSSEWLDGNDCLWRVQCRLIHLLSTINSATTHHK